AGLGAGGDRVVVDLAGKRRGRSVVDPGAAVEERDDGAAVIAGLEVPAVPEGEARVVRSGRDSDGRRRGGGGLAVAVDRRTGGAAEAEDVGTGHGWGAGLDAGPVVGRPHDDPAAPVAEAAAGLEGVLVERERPAGGGRH